MVDFDAFLSWAESRFGEAKVKGSQIMLNSPFAEAAGFGPDSGNHLSCNVEGGKKKVRDGVFRCFKSEKTGSLVTLVMITDGCDYDEAIEVLGGATSAKINYQKIEEFFNAKKPKPPEPEPEIKKIKLPDFTYPLMELAPNNPIREQALEYLAKRKLPPENLNICTRGEYRNRLVIPYYNKDGELIYFNGRHLRDNFKPKYLGPPAEIGVGKGDVLYFPQWPKENSLILLTEGEFDALTLFLCGFNTAACGGKALSERQVELLRPYKVCLAMDNDIAGKKATFQMGNTLLESGFNKRLFYVAPRGYKDWNDMLIYLNSDILENYIETEMKPFTVDTSWTKKLDDRIL
jgi:DNA primase